LVLVVAMLNKILILFSKFPCYIHTSYLTDCIVVLVVVVGPLHKRFFINLKMNI